MSDVKVESLTVSAYTVPTDAPESDGTMKWDSTTMILAEATGGGERGLGYTYGDICGLTSRRRTPRGPKLEEGR